MLREPDLSNRGSEAPVTKSAEDSVSFSGDPNITATHQKTFEITKDPAIHGDGDCIIGVAASKACVDLDENMKMLLRKEDSRVMITIRVGEHMFQAEGTGHPELSLKHKTDIVVRRSRFICTRTLAISCSKTAADIPKEMVHLLKDPSTKGSLTIRVETP